MTEKNSFFTNEFNIQKKILFDDLSTYLQKNFNTESNFETDAFIINESKIIANRVLDNIQKWISYNIPQTFQDSIFSYIKNKKWDEIIDAFYDEIEFGTSSIRGKMIPGTNLDIIEKDFDNFLNSELNSKILRGTNTINEVNISHYTYGLVNYMKNSNMSHVVVGFDSRIHSQKFANIVSEIFLLNGFQVYIFDEPNPLPELVFALQHVNADIGIEITASHNDKRYNGYKIITKSGAPPNTLEKKEISHYILDIKNQSSVKKILLDSSFEKIAKNKNLTYLHNFSNDVDDKFDIGKLYINKLKNLIYDKKNLDENASNIKIGYSSLHGTGFNIASKLFDELKIQHFDIEKMVYPDSTFFTFDTFQMLDPGEFKTANIIFENFIQEYGIKKFRELDALLYNDPDADRLGIIVNVKESEQKFFGNWKLLTANELWSILLWYILEKTSQSNNIKKEELFTVKSFITTDTITSLCRNFGIDNFDGKVGFSDLSQIAVDQMGLGKINLGIFEESNGFTISGNPNVKNNHKSHFLEKDGMLAMTLTCELIAFLKSKKSSILEFLDVLYCEKTMNCFITSRTQIPEKGMFEGVIGDTKKKNLMKNIEKYADEILSKLKSKENISIANIPISNVKKFATGKYDDKFWKDFPDEGIRFYLNSKNNHITVRNSGTESKIRIFIQYQVHSITKQNISNKKIDCQKLVEKIQDEFRNNILKNIDF